MNTNPANEIQRAIHTAKDYGCNRTTPHDDERGLRTVEHPAQSRQMAPYLEAAFGARLAKSRTH